MTIETITKTLNYASDFQTGSASAPLPVGVERAKPAPKSEFERFEDLASKLVQVPKADMDEKRSKS